MSGCNCAGCQCKEQPMKNRSNQLTGTPGSNNWVKRAPARGMMRAVGYTDEDFQKPLVAVGAPYTDITPCNKHLLELGQIMEKELEKVGAKPYIFGTPVITDGETMGTEGMKYSLVSRELIADSLEMMIEGY